MGVEPWQETHSLESRAATSQGRSDATAPLLDPPVPDPPLPEPPVPDPLLPGPPPVPPADSPTIEPTQPGSATNKETARANADESAELGFLVLRCT